MPLFKFWVCSQNLWLVCVKTGGSGEKRKKGPAGGWFTCGGDHFQVDCPKNDAGKGKEENKGKPTWEEGKNWKNKVKEENMDSD